MHIKCKECVFFKQGFCYNGPNCVRRHVKRLPDELPREAAFDQGISSSSGSGGGSGTTTSGSAYSGGGASNNASGGQMNKKKKTGGGMLFLHYFYLLVSCPYLTGLYPIGNDNYKVSLCNHWLLNGMLNTTL